MNRIEVAPDIMFGKPVIKGTRITVELVLEELGAGKSMNELLNSHPTLTQEGIWAAFQFAADAMRGERIYPIAV